MSDLENSPTPMSEDERPNGAAKGANSDAEDAAVDNNDLQEDMDDLFGDAGDDDDVVPDKQRELDDSELDSGDDEARNDRVGVVDDEVDEAEQQMLNILNVDWDRNGAPMPSDGEMYLMKVPRFLAFHPKAFHVKGFEPPVTEHHSRNLPESNFSAYKIAMTTIRWRRSPSKPSELQSNARVLRWSDGSLTLQFASDPLTQYEIQANPLAAPQLNPVKPTPLSRLDNSGRVRPNKSGKEETYTYLGQPSSNAGVIPLVQKFTTGLQVIPAGNTTDDAMEKLRRSMAAANADNLLKTGAFTQTGVIEDPEMQKKRAEVAEKEKLRMQRKMEQQAQKENLRNNRAVQKLGLGGGGRSTGLTLAGLEDDGFGSAPRRSGGKKSNKNKRRSNTQYEEWSGDEEEGEDYEEDDFVAGDDDEDEDAQGEDEEEDIDALIERRERNERIAGLGPAAAAAASKPKSTREDTPKRGRAEDDDEVGQQSPVSRAKRRRVVDEEDDDE